MKLANRTHLKLDNGGSPFKEYLKSSLGGLWFMCAGIGYKQKHLKRASGIKWHFVCFLKKSKKGWDSKTLHMVYGLHIKDHFTWHLLHLDAAHNQLHPPYVLSIQKTPHLLISSCKIEKQKIPKPICLTALCFLCCPQI